MRVRVLIAFSAMLICANVFATAASATYDTDRYNRPGLERGDNNEQRVAGDRATVVIRDGDGNPMTDLYGAPVVSATYSCPTSSNANRRCVEVQTLEMIQARGADGILRQMYYVYSGGRAGAKSGFVTLSEFAAQPPVDISKAKGNGATGGIAAPPDAPGTPRYTIRPSDIGSSSDQWYWPDFCPGMDHCSYRPYGRPFTTANVAMMVWSWPHNSRDERLEGGGLARALFKSGQTFYPSDVNLLRVPTYAPAATQAESQALGPNGYINVRFGYVKNSNNFKFWGWMVMSHEYKGRCYDHMAYAGGGPALADSSCTSFQTIGLRPGPFQNRGDSVTSSAGNVTLRVGDYLMSRDLRSTLIMQSDGNLVLYRPNFSAAPVTTGTNGTGAQEFVIGTDGDLSLTTGQSTPLTGVTVWRLGTSGNGPVRLTLQDDGNLVLRRVSDNGLVWHANTGGLPALTEVQGTVAPSGLPVSLASGQSLGIGQYVKSPDGRYALVQQTDGNLVLYAAGYRPLWSTSTQGTPTNRTSMQTDGNLVSYTAGNVATWNTGTQGNPGASLAVQNDGNLVVYGSAGNPLWYTGTQGRN